LRKRHTAKNIANVLASVLRSNGILGKKLGTGVSDNIELNSAVMRNVAKYVQHLTGVEYDPVKRRGR
jgi:hypothetical protein